jgi:hypothetical protein
LTSLRRNNISRSTRIRTRFVFIIGVIALIIGVIDPLEGSVVIAVGSVLMAVVAYFKADRHFKTFILTALLIVFGVCFLFYLSSLGEFGGKFKLIWWWDFLILPYPIGWLIAIILLIIRALKKEVHS